MKGEIFLTLDKNSDRPIVELVDNLGLLVLIDTGARFPVWTADTESLIALGGRLFKNGISYSGVGGETTGDIYKIPSFSFGDGAHSLVFPELPVVTNTEFEDAPFQMILSATMLHNLEYTINDKRHSLVIRIPDDESEIRNAILRVDDDFQVLFT